VASTPKGVMWFSPQMAALAIEGAQQIMHRLKWVPVEVVRKVR